MDSVMHLRKWRFYKGVARVLLCAFLMQSTAIFADDFGGPSQPGDPPPGDDGCPDCCKGEAADREPGDCPQGPDCGTSKDKVNYWDGRERHAVTDLVIPGYIPIVFERSYDNQIDYDSAVGYGWSHNYDMRAFRSPDAAVYLRTGGGARRKFVLSSSCGGPCPAGTRYISPKGEYANVLEENGDGTLTYLDASGTEFKFDLKGRLASITDVRGAKLAMEYDPGGRLPIKGRSKYSPDPNALGTVALEYRLKKVVEYDPLGVLTNRFIELAYDPANGRLTAIADHTHRTWSYVHGTSGNLEQVGLPENNVFTYAYGDANDDHNLTSIDEGLTKVTLVYDNLDRVDTETSATGTIWDPQYDIPGLRTTVTKTVKNPEDNSVLRTSTWVYEFSATSGDGSPSKITDPFGTTFVYPRDTKGRTTTSTVSKAVGGGGTTPVRNADTSNRDAMGNIQGFTVIDAQSGEQLTTSATFQQNATATARVSVSTNPGVTQGFDHLWINNTRGYPKFLQFEKRISGQDVNGFQFLTTEFVPDQYFQVESIKYPGLDTDTFTYANGYLTGFNGEVYAPDSRGNVLTVTDRLGKVWTYVYDDLDRVTSVLSPTGERDLYHYVGFLLDSTETGKLGTVRGRVNHYEYDAVGRVTRVKTEVPSGSTNLVTVATIHRDSDGYPIKLEDAELRPTLLSYDALDRPTSVTDATGHTLHSEYDVQGNVVRLWNGGTRESKFDNRAVRTPGPPVKMYDGNGKSVTLKVDALGIRRGFTDPLNHLVVEDRDAAGRLKAFAAWGFAQTTFQYTGRGGIDSRTLPGGSLIDYTYNERGALTGVALAGTDTIQIERDPDDRVRYLIDSDFGYLYTWDDVGRLKSEAKYPPVGRAVEMQYDGRGRRTFVTTPDGTSIEYRYNDLDQLTDVFHSGVLEAHYDSDNSGLVEKITYAGGSIEVAYTPDAAGRIVSQEAKYFPQPGNPATAVLLNRIEYLDRDESNFVRRKHVIAKRPNGTSLDQYFHYTYDNAGRLQREAVYDSTDTVVQSGRTYTYDDVGNRLSMVEDSGPTSNYHYDAASYRLLSVDVGGTTTEQLTYKPNGRGQVDTYTKSGSAVTYSYDMEGRVTAIDTPTVDSSFVLSADGRRVRKTVAGVATDIVYDGLNTLKEYPQSAAPVTYVADSRLDSQFLRTDGSTKTYYLRDLQTGSVIQAVSTSGAVTGEQIFRAFGEPHESNGDAGPFGFAGRYGETGASSADFRERQYAPSLGRFLAVDPLRPDAIHGLPIGGPARFALAASGVQRESVPTGAVLDTAGYLFAGNNPVSFFDPTGEPIPVIIGAVLLGLWLGGELDAFLDNLGLYFDCSISKSELIRRTGKQITWSIAGFMIGAAIGEAVAATVRWARELFQAERGASGLVGDAASGARGLSRDTVEGARYGEYWEKLKGRAPERSSPYDVVRRYDANGNISGATTYDRFGNRAYQYEFDAGARHGPGFHTYDNSGPSGGFGKGPRSPHQTW